MGAWLLAAQLTVFAASSLGEAFTELGGLFEQEHPGVTVAFNFAGSQELRTQLEHGARADVVASADKRQMQALVAARLAGTPSIFARNEPVLVVPRGNPAGIHDLADLPRARRIVLGAEVVPIGAYSARVLAAAAARYGARYGQAVEERISSRELNVRQVLAKVKLGEADAGIVYRTDAIAAGGTVEAIPLPAGLAARAEYPIAVVRGAPEPKWADGFVRLVLSPAGRAVLARHGFL